MGCEARRRDGQGRSELSRASEMALPLPWEPLRYAQGSRYAPQWNDAANSIDHYC